jgi:hypothetical protein
MSSVYLETTIPSYLTARQSQDLVSAARQQITQQWWNTRRQDFELFVSQLVIDEASAGDANAAARRLKILEACHLYHHMMTLTYSWSCSFTILHFLIALRPMPCTSLYPL